MNRKGQEEIIGFVLIMVVVAVVALILLGLSVRNQNTGTRESNELYQFLQSSSEFTTDCKIRNTEYARIQDLFGLCLDNGACLNGLDSCDVLLKDMRGLIDASWNIGNESQVRGYLFVSSYEAGVEASPEEIIRLEEGDCAGARVGSSYLIPEFPGRIANIFHVCY